MNNNSDIMTLINIFHQNSGMLLTVYTNQLKSYKEEETVHQLQRTIDGRYVLLVQKQKSQPKRSIRYLDKDGKIIRTYNFEIKVDKFVIKNSQLLLATSQEGKLFVMDLRGDEIKEHTFTFLKEGYVDHKYDVFMFQESGLVCIAERLLQSYYIKGQSMYKDKSGCTSEVKLTYFQLSFEEMREVKVWSIPTRNMKKITMKRINSISEVVILYVSHSDQFQIVVNTLNFDSLNIDSVIFDLKPVPNVHLEKISHVSKLSQNRLRVFIKEQEQKPYIISKTGSQTEVKADKSLELPPEELKPKNIAFMRDYTAFFKSNSSNNPVKEHGVIHFYDEKTLAQKWTYHCPQKNQTHHLNPCRYDNNILVDWFKGGKGIYHVRRLMFFQQKDAYMQMLLHMNEDFDDDLLLDCMNVLVEDE